MQRVQVHPAAAGVGLYIENNGSGSFDLCRMAPVCFGLKTHARLCFFVFFVRLYVFVFDTLLEFHCPPLF